MHSLAVVEVGGPREIDFGEVDGVAFAELPEALQAGLLSARIDGTPVLELINGSCVC